MTPSFAAAMRALAQADVLVCPRTSWSGFPIKVLNYMALGRPIVHARASAHALEDGVTGLLYDDGDAGALAKALLRVVRDPALAAQLGRQARIVARERFTAAAGLPVSRQSTIAWSTAAGWPQPPARPGPRWSTV